MTYYWFHEPSSWYFETRSRKVSEDPDVVQVDRKTYEANRYKGDGTMAMKKKGKGRSISVDMSGVESGGKAVPDGVHPLEVVEVTEEEGNEYPYLKWKFRVTDGPAKGGIIYDNTSLSPNALWCLKGALEVMGQEVPDEAMDINLDDLEGATLTATIANEEYQGKTHPKIAQYGGEAGEDSEDDDSDSKRNRKKTKPGKASSKKDTAETDDDDGDDDDDDDKPKFKVGQRVKFTDDGKTYKGKISAIDDDTATVNANGEDWEISVDDLTAI